MNKRSLIVIAGVFLGTVVGVLLWRWLGNPFLFPVSIFSGLGSGAVFSVVLENRVRDVYLTDRRIPLGAGVGMVCGATLGVLVGNLAGTPGMFMLIGTAAGMLVGAVSGEVVNRRPWRLLL